MVVLAIELPSGHNAKCLILEDIKIKVTLMLVSVMVMWCEMTDVAFFICLYVLNCNLCMPFAHLFATSLLPMLYKDRKVINIKLWYLYVVYYNLCMSSTMGLCNKVHSPIITHVSIVIFFFHEKTFANLVHTNLIANGS